MIALGALGATAFTLPAATPASANTGSPAPTGVVVNEIIYDAVSGIQPDQVELYNTGTETVDLTGWQVADDKLVLEPLPTGLTIAPGEFLVLINGTDFQFGLGKGDAFNLYDASGTLVDGYTYVNTAPLGTWARCVDGTGEWAHATAPTPGLANVCAPLEVTGSVVLNEVDSSPSDWVELYNPGTTALNLTGFELRDNSDDHRWKFAEGATIAGGEYLVVGETTSGLAFDDATSTWVAGTFTSAIGIGSADMIRLYDPAGALIDETGAWTGHAAIGSDLAAATLARCVDGIGSFDLAFATPGETNRCVPPAIAINEIESNGDATDWVEILNIGDASIDISGWTVLDSDPIGHAADVTPVAAGTILAPGALFVFDQPTHFTFGLGKADTVSVRSAVGAVVAEQSWTDHAAGVLGRCPNGVGEFLDLEVSTKGLLNACGNPVRINEVVTNPADWVELVNPTGSTLDVSGIVVKDDDDTHVYTVADGTTITAGGYLVIDDLTFGLGKADSVRLFDGGDLIDSTTWGPEHPLPSWGRCVDTSGTFAITAAATPGAPNQCAGEIAAVLWPGAADVQVLDPTPTFLQDSSGLDVQVTDEGVFLWAVDNGSGRFWKLAVAADGSVSPVAGWEAGKRARFQKDAGSPSAAGPDSEGITVAGDGSIYLAIERDNSAKGVNFNVVMKVNPDAAGPDVVASQEWDLTSVLPAVGANLGLEAVEWVADTELAGKLWDRNTNAPYDPAAYVGHGNGLFIVGVEDQGQVFAVALLEGGAATIVAELTPGLGGVMALDYDSVLGVLWAVCDDGCSGTAAQISLNGTDTPDVAHVLRPAGLPNINNEGFATAPASLAVEGKRPAWWFADGFASASLRLGALDFAGGGDGETGDAGETGETGGVADPGSGTSHDANQGGNLANTGAVAPPVLPLVAGALLIALAGLVFARSRSLSRNRAALSHGSAGNENS